jgi:murein DD-endopeptidase MepM/ murein hydrolase activator NlpD
LSGAGVAHRLPSPPSALRGRVVVAAVAAGAVVAAAQTFHAGGTTDAQSITPLANGGAMAPNVGMGGVNLSPEVVPIQKVNDPSLAVAQLAKSERLSAVQQAKNVEAVRAHFVRPADGTYTSGFGGRWGAFHYGIDIANAIGTPIVAAADGTVIEAGPATGFGLWVRIKLDDGETNVYGHVDTILCKQGQRVQAGQKIATMGNRGFSTGPHLHFEVWDANDRKINPLPWLSKHGIFF